MIQFIFSRKFLINLVLAIGAIAIFLGSTYVFLSNYTRPDEVTEVPDVVGFDIIEAEATLKHGLLQAVIVDSLFIKAKRGGEIVSQEPSEGSSVKENRKIYLTITRYSSPMVKMPNIFQGLPAALARLNSYRFEIGEISSKPAECTDCVIDVIYKGKSVKVGTKVPEGARLNLVVGAGTTGELIPVPVLYGMDTAQVLTFLQLKGLNLGAAPCADCETAEDSAKAVVYRQLPEPDEENMISIGSSIDVFLTSDSSLVPLTDSVLIEEL